MQDRGGTTWLHASRTISSLTHASSGIATLSCAPTQENADDRREPGRAIWKRLLVSFANSRLTRQIRTGSPEMAERRAGHFERQTA